ncbi:hypothetical protein [Bradyrhizobium aeschynomenes]|nr:hypothetical protein [Bradyrhizobium aeschynomenes]NPV21185.1 hypothetical protein [Bradyrhizobium aeschynomenes]
MASWLELLFNIIGYGGFVVIASRHHAPESVDLRERHGDVPGVDGDGL